MNKTYIIDGHCDTVHLFLNRDYNFTQHNTFGHIDLPRLMHGGVSLQFFAMFIEPEYKPYQSLARSLQLLDHFLVVTKSHLQIIKTLADLEASITGSHPAALIALEGGEPLEHGREILHILYRLGVRSIGLTWNQRNGLADGVGVGKASGGLTSLGKEMVREMNRLGMLVDGAHLASRGFNDLLEAAEKPVFVSHANAARICPNPRNLKDDQLLALRQQGGLIGVSFYPGFIAQNKEASLDLLLDHFCHIADVAGIETLGLGSDFDGIEEVLPELPDVSYLPVLINGLFDRGFSAQEVDAILGGNYLRLLRANLLQEETL